MEPNQEQPQVTGPQQAGGHNDNRKLKRNLLLIALACMGTVVLLAVFTKLNQKPEPTVTSRQVIVEITKDGFVPATLSIPKGTRVTWVNKGSGSHQVAANPHPEHSSVQGLDSRSPIGSDNSYSYTFDQPGTYTYHDHMNPANNGTVVVE